MIITKLTITSTPTVNSYGLKSKASAVACRACKRLGVTGTMVDDCIIDKVGWHTQTEGNPETPEYIELKGSGRY